MKEQYTNITRKGGTVGMRGQPSGPVGKVTPRADESRGRLGLRGFVVRSLEGQEPVPYLRLGNLPINWQVLPITLMRNYCRTSHAYGYG